MFESLRQENLECLGVAVELTQCDAQAVAVFAWSPRRPIRETFSPDRERTIRTAAAVLVLSILELLGAK